MYLLAGGQSPPDGARAEARQLYERLLSLTNDAGLISEEYDTKNRRLLGNSRKVHPCGPGKPGAEPFTCPRSGRYVSRYMNLSKEVPPAGRDLGSVSCRT